MRRTLFFTFAGAALPLFVSGCAGVAEVRARAADLVVEVPGNYISLANCVASDLALNPDYPEVATLRLNEVDRTARLYRLNEPAQSVRYDVTFTQRGDKVLVEARGMETIRGRDYWVRPFPGLAQSCSARLLAVNRQAPF